jgi:flagellar biosynthesis/type III secretory pathway protein FliH
MAGKLRVGGVTIKPDLTYNGYEVIRLCNVSFENGMRAAKQAQAVPEQALQDAWDRGYQEGKQARSDELTGVLEALKVLKDYFQDT